MTSNDPPRAGDAAIAGLADRTTGLVGWTIAWRATSAVATLALGAFLIRQLPASEYGRYTFVLGGIATGVLSFALVAIYDMRSQAIATPIAGALTLALAVVFLRLGVGLNGVLIAGAIGQSALAVVYFAILIRRIDRARGIPADRIGWRRLLVYASGWLPSLL